MQSHSQSQSDHRRIELHFTLVRLGSEGAITDILDGKTDRTTNPNDNDDTVVSLEPIESPLTINGSTTKNTTPPTIHDWFQYVESLYQSSNGCGHAHDPIKRHNDINIAQALPVPTILPSQSTLSIWEQTKFSILQYIQSKDQFTNLTSLLLKSYAYYCYFKRSRPPTPLPHPSSHIPARPIMILPRTIYNQPFIPLNISLSDPIISGTSFFSISHQYPIVALIQQKIPVATNINEDGGKSPSSPLVEMAAMMMVVGLDIVIFDAHYSPKLYNSFMEYIQVYEEYFTPSEWNDRIMMNSDTISDNTRQNDMDILREFYIQWSIKEAYTKALGFGMNIDFQCFETEIDISTCCVINSSTSDAIDDMDRRNRISYHDTLKVDSDNYECTDRLWQWIRHQCCATMADNASNRHSHQQHYVVCTVGTVTQISSTPCNPDNINVTRPELHRPRREHFYFYFYPIFGNDKNDKSDMIGCATICYGPIQELPSPSNDPNFPPIHVQYKTLLQLIEYHTAVTTEAQL